MKRFVVVIEADDLTEPDDLRILVNGNDQDKETCKRCQSVLQRLVREAS